MRTYSIHIIKHNIWERNRGEVSAVLNTSIVTEEVFEYNHVANFDSYHRM